MEPLNLWNKNFILLWLGNAQSGIGNTFYIIALSYLMLELTGSPKYTAFTMAAFAVPFVLSPLVGTMVDRVNMKPFLVVGDIIRGFCMFLICYLYEINLLSSSVIVCLGFVSGVVGLIYRPSFGALLPNLVPKKDISRANALNALAGQISSLFGFAFGGLMIGFIGTIPAIFVNGATFIIMALLLCFIDFPMVKKESQERKSVLNETIEGIKYVISSKLLFIVPVIFFVLSATYSPLEFLMPVKLKSINVGAEGYGVFFTILTIGSILASGVISKIGNHLSVAKGTLTGLVIIAVSLLGIALSNSYILFCVFAFTLGFGISLSSVNVISYAQTNVSEKFRGRMFGIFGAIEQVAMPATLAGAGILVDYFPVHFIFIMGTIVIAVVSIWWFVLNNFARYAN
ncbi:MULTISPECIES: MFS transporter [Thermoactinomyces]|jgi:MFS transporter, DHA3 family, macrolide efflux protein|uniref:MFS transporter n=1 Tax=Thermoactinomyces vulgaris TaxID=2026 RepID=A0ABS0QD70_THEVU|nr:MULTISPECIES: MFS transporter [Thermoactinomyces]KYQ87992.1 hypothetical protein AYX07_04785 [Thermoactinomyces sp. AS95]MBA4550578.1 MFS transporter [Thermoactinomyces vulgaris]MBA4595989.1 MFS transporter [Thermoactinomyces vulgaris]MBH8587226.1 MFS transporter [Thermoactinomyces vulgaris]MBI0386444.1 MFS transporter [Thermoactinomyces sp. CICC 24227]